MMKPALWDTNENRRRNAAFFYRHAHSTQRVNSHRGVAASKQFVNYEFAANTFCLAERIHFDLCEGF
jgi:hypothetical protein